MWDDTFHNMRFSLEGVCEVVASSTGRKVGDMHSTSLFPEADSLSIHNRNLGLDV